MTDRRAYTMVEVVIALAIGLSTLAIVLRLGTLFGRPTDHRERVREASIGLALALERIVRSVRDASLVQEATRHSLLLRMPEGEVDLWRYLRAPGSDAGELVLVEDVVGPGAAAREGKAPIETVILQGVTRCHFSSPSSPPALPGLPFDSLALAPPPEGTAVECMLETFVDGSPVRERTTASCRNASWQVLWR